MTQPSAAHLKDCNLSYVSEQRILAKEDDGPRNRSSVTADRTQPINHREGQAHADYLQGIGNIPACNDYQVTKISEGENKGMFQDYVYLLDGNVSNAYTQQSDGEKFQIADGNAEQTQYKNAQ
jgi:hypothetical protein